MYTNEGKVVENIKKRRSIKSIKIRGMETTKRKQMSCLSVPTLSKMQGML